MPLFGLISFAQDVSASWLAASALQGTYDETAITNCNGTTFTVQSGTKHVLKISDCWGRPITPSGEGKVICSCSNPGETVRLYCDHEGNLLVGVNDTRNNQSSGTSSWGYALYKISEKGEIVWTLGLAEGAAFPSATLFDVVQDAAGDYICCYASLDAAATTDYTYIETEKVSKDGKSVWRNKLYDPNFNYIYNYPYLVDGSEGDVMMVYAYGSNQDLYASRISTADGSQVWKTRFYRSGFPSDISLRDNVRVLSDGKGGVFALWYDDRANDGYWSAYVNYVGADGKIAYPNKLNGVQVAYTTDESFAFSHSNMSFCHSEKEQCVYVAMRYYDANDSLTNGVLVQKISDEGKLMWSNEGIAVETAVKNLTVANPQPQVAPDGGCVVFYQTGDALEPFGESICYAVKYAADGTKRWSKRIDDTNTNKVQMVSSPLIAYNCWIVSWNENAVNGYPRYAVCVSGNECVSENYTFTDGDAYSKIIRQRYKEIVYTRTFKNTNWQALYVPFSMDYEEWCEDYEIARVYNFIDYDDNDDGEFDRTYLVVKKITSGSTRPNYPYLIRAKATGTQTLVLTDKMLEAAQSNSMDCSSADYTYTFTGSYTPVTNMYANGYYALSGGSLQRANSASVVLGAQRWYMSLTARSGGYAATKAQSIKIVVDGEDETEAIEAPSCSSKGESPVAYDLMGRGVKGAVKGISIVNGKKIIN